MAERQGPSEGLVVAGGTAFAYCLAYAYSAYASHFGLPPLLVTPTLGGILTAAAAVGLVVMMFANIASIVWPFTPTSETARGRAIRTVVRMALLIGLFSFAALEGTRAWLVFLGMTSFIAFFELVWPFITQKGITGYEAKLDAQEDVESTFQDRTIFGWLHSRLGPGYYQALYAALILLFLAHLIGGHSATTKEDFFVLADEPGYVVVSMDDSMVVLAGFEPDTLLLNGLFKVQRFDDERSWALREEKIGRLKAKPRTSAIPAKDGQ
jgi:hypothetical protein